MTRDPGVVILAMARLPVTRFLNRKENLSQPFFRYLQQTISLLDLQFPNERNLLSHQHQKASNDRLMHSILFQLGISLQVHIADLPEHC